MFGFDLIDAALLPAMLIALSAGVLSFLSPCVLPIVPPYLAYMSGISMQEMSGDDAALRRKAIAPALFFVLGLSTVFLFLGFTASAFGMFFLRYQEYLAIGAGAVIYLFGLHFVGLNRALMVLSIIAALLGLSFSISAAFDPDVGFWQHLSGAIAEYRMEIILLVVVSIFAQVLPFNQFPFLMYEARIDAGDRGGSAFGAYVLGLAFAFGWTPCIGPILGAILSLAASDGDVVRGTMLLGLYAMGLGLPFLLAAIFVQRSMKLMNRLKPYMHRIERAMGGLLIIVGVALLTGAFTDFSWWLLETFPALGLIG